jgi:hypothetical protein
MAISFVGAATGTNTATLPSFESGDIAVAFAFRDGSATNPTIPGTFTNITNTLDTTSGSGSVGWRRLVVGDTTIGTWTNASRCVVGVYRGCEPFITPVGGGANGTGTTNASVALTTFTMTRGDGTSWVLGFVGHRSVDTDLGTLWTNMVSLRDNTADATAETTLQDTNAGVSSWSTQTRNIGGTNSGWVSRTVELLALPTQLDFRHPVAPIQIAHSRSL